MSIRITLRGNVPDATDDEAVLCWVDAGGSVAPVDVATPGAAHTLIQVLRQSAYPAGSSITASAEDGSPWPPEGGPAEEAEDWAPGAPEDEPDPAPAVDAAEPVMRSRKR